MLSYLPTYLLRQARKPIYLPIYLDIYFKYILAKFELLFNVTQKKIDANLT